MHFVYVKCKAFVWNLFVFPRAVPVDVFRFLLLAPVKHLAGGARGGGLDVVAGLGLRRARAAAVAQLPHLSEL